LLLILLLLTFVSSAQLGILLLDALPLPPGGLRGLAETSLLLELL
jgi:hypothetical protein